jgi:hypothetical protein
MDWRIGLYGLAIGGVALVVACWLLVFFGIVI